MDISTYNTCPDEYQDVNEPDRRLSKELDFVNHWLKSIPSEINRGASLRYIKSGTKRDVCDVAGLSVDKVAPYFECRKNRYHKVTTTYSSPRRRSHRSPSSSRTLSQPQTVVSNRKARSRPCTPKKTPRKCPLRIAELAQPSKRLCLDTWRTKCHMLPNIMLDRLKQIVMDQKTIAHIPDAIDCFRVAKRNNIRAKKVKNINESKKLDPRQMEYVRQLCAVFGHRIANKLIAPRNVVLNSDLENISQVVHNEIECMIKCDGLLYKKNVVNNKRIHKEMTDKITVWIAAVLDDSNQKLLEEELRVKRLKEIKRLHQEDCYETLIGTETQAEVIHKHLQLEEEEGPVLDLLDDLVDNVVGMCYKEDSIDNALTVSEVVKEYFDGGSSPERMSVSSYGTGDDKDIANSKHNVDSKNVDDTVTSEANRDLDDGVRYGDDGGEDNLGGNDQGDNDLDGNEPGEDYLGGDEQREDGLGGDEQGDNYLDGEQDDNERSEVGRDRDDLYDSATSDTAGGSSAPTLDVDPLNSQSSKDGDEVNNELFVDNLVDRKTNEEKIKAILNTIIDQANVSEVYIVIDEDPHGNKTVKFTDRDMVIAGNSVDLDSISDVVSEDPSTLFSQEPKKPPPFPKPQISNLGPANENLLSDADESWPLEDIITPMLRMSISVSKSITSLGKIVEDDGEVNIFDQRYDISGIEEASSILHLEELDDLPPMNQKTEVLEEIKIQPNEKKSIDLIKSNEAPLSTITDESKHLASIIKDIGKGDNSDIDEQNDILVVVHQKKKAPTKFNYKVNPKSAPSWVRRSQSSEESLISQLNIKNRHMSCLARKLAGELDQAFATLERWNLWMDSTCRKVIFLKQRQVANKVFSCKNSFDDYKDWIKFKKCVDKDVILWNKLNCRLTEKFNTVKTKFTLMQDWKKISNALRTGSIWDNIDNFDRSCSWTQRTVSGEYNVKCNCQNRNRKNVNDNTIRRRPCQPNTSKK